MTYTSVLPPTVAVNAILEPSGEKYGSVSTVGVAVRRRAWPPARLTAQRSPAYWNAMSSRLTVGWRRRRVPWAWASAVSTTPRTPNANDRTITEVSFEIRTALSSRAAARDL